MEDSIVINKASIERGCFNITYYKNEIAREEENKIEGESIVFNNPYSIIENGIELKDIKFANYKKLDDQGFPILNEYIHEGDAYIGKTKIKTEFVEDKYDVNNIFGNKTKKEVYSDRSIIATKIISGIVDKVFVHKDEENKRICKVRFRKIRQPELGDKLCSRNAQKGVVGMIVPIENMPFSKDGIVPDIIINPHAIPSRMTIAHLLECVLGKAACFMGTIIDATPFNNNVYDDVYDELEKAGMERHGNEILYNGITGTQIPTEIFIGPTYYERLKHMVADKINYRSTGFKTVQNEMGEYKTLKVAPVVATTRQPVSGRGSGNSANRVGEMEVTAMIAHGIAENLKENLMEKSDKFQIIVDNDSEFINKGAIQDAEDVSYVEIPFACKTLIQELAGLSIKTHLLTKKEIDEDNYDDHAFEEISSSSSDDEEDT
jgi:DNA-directed RNA polymerase II subunit RPB2